jgi:hypothetical protein
MDPLNCQRDSPCESPQRGNGPVLSPKPKHLPYHTGEFAAACSLGSCSLPPGLGFGIPHYVSPAASALFDEGWLEPFWSKYTDADRILIEENICRNIDEELKKGADEPG